MARRTPFEPDVTLGELLLLAEMTQLYKDGFGSPAAELARRTKHTPTAINRALLRIKDALGDVEFEGQTRRTLRPNPTGQNVGAAAFLANFLIRMAIDPEIDQSKLAVMIAELTVEAQRRSQAGKRAADHTA